MPGRDAWFSLILIPLLVPTPVLAIAWIFLLGPTAGWINVWLRGLFGLTGSGPLNVFSMPGLIVCQALALTPFVFLLLTATLKSMNPSFEEASNASGASPLTTFRRVTLPVLLPGILAPVILALLITLEQFEIPLIIGQPARINVFSYRIWNELNPSDGLPNYGGAAAAALPFLALGILLLIFYNRLIRRAERFVTVTGNAFRQKRLPLVKWRWPALAFAASYVALAAILPGAVLLWTSFFGYAPISVASLGKFSVAAYTELVVSPVFWTALRNTIVVATLSAVIVTAIGGLLGWIIVRTRFRGRRLVDFLSFLSIGIPSVIAGLAIMLLYLSLPIGLYGTVWILVIAYSYRFAVTTRVSRAGLMQIHPELEEASSASGARWIATQRRILLPLLLPSLISGFVLLFIVGVREFTLSLVLYSQENVVLSVMLWRLFLDSHGATAAALGSIMIVLVVPVGALVRRQLAPRITDG
jgi:iron(III) transport system permease protein